MNPASKESQVELPRWRKRTGICGRGNGRSDRPPPFCACWASETRETSRWPRSWADGEQRRTTGPYVPAPRQADLPSWRAKGGRGGLRACAGPAKTMRTCRPGNAPCPRGPPRGRAERKRTTLESSASASGQLEGKCLQNQIGASVWWARGSKRRSHWECIARSIHTKIKSQDNFLDR